MQGHVLPAVIQAAAGRGAARPRPEDTRSLDSPKTPYLDISNIA